MIEQSATDRILRSEPWAPKFLHRDPPLQEYARRTRIPNVDLHPVALLEARREPPTPAEHLTPASTRDVTFSLRSAKAVREAHAEIHENSLVAGTHVADRNPTSRERSPEHEFREDVSHTWRPSGQVARPYAFRSWSPRSHRSLAVCRERVSCSGDRSQLCDLHLLTPRPAPPLADQTAPPAVSPDRREWARCRAHGKSSYPPYGYSARHRC